MIVKREIADGMRRRRDGLRRYMRQAKETPAGQ
jgi:hypothetical protein